MYSKALKTCAATIAVLVLIVFLFQKRFILLQILTVTLYSLCFSALLSPLTGRLERSGCSSSLASLASILILCLSLLLIASCFVPYLVSKSLDLIRHIIPPLLSWLSEMSARFAQTGFQQQNMAKLTDLLTSTVAAVSMYITQAGFAAVKQFGSIVFSLVISYYLLKERKKLTSHFLLLLPAKTRGICQSAVLGCKNALLGYLSGVLKTSAFVALAAWICLGLLGVPGAFVLALFMGIFEIVPYIGPVLASIPILLVTIQEGIPYALLCLSAVILIQQLEGNIITPYFTASSTSIHPLLALVGAFIGGAFFGLGGILLAIPLMIIARTLYWIILKQGIS